MLRRILLLAPMVALALPAFSPAATVGHLRIAFGTDQDWLHPALTGRRNAYVALQPWQTDRLRQLKAANAHVKVLAYKNLSMMISGRGGAYSSTGVNVDERPPEEWFLHDHAGNRITSSGWPYLWMADPGEAAYQRRWLENVLPELRRNGWDGVFMDDVNPSVQAHTDPADVREYRDDGAYQRAVRSMLARVGTRVRAKGPIAMANLGSFGMPRYKGVLLGWLKYLDGGLMEHLGRWAGMEDDPKGGYLSVPDWESEVETIKQTEARGKTFLGMTKGPHADAKAARYGFATVLLAAAGRSYFAYHHGSDENWLKEYGYKLGRPLGDERADPSGVHRRYFTRGLVVVNPTSTRKWVSFGGTYSGSGVTNATGAEMRGHTGLVLRARGRGPRRSGARSVRTQRRRATASRG